MTDIPATFRIIEMMPEFSEKETIIANYILKNKEEFTNSSISYVSNQLNIANSTLTSFARKIGYNGFSKLKIALLTERHQQQETNKEINENSTSIEIANIVFTSSITHLSNTLNIISKKDLDNAVDTIIESASVHFFGLGGSNAIAYDFYHQFLRLPIKSNYASDFHIQLMNASHMTSKDCAFIISHTGRDKDCIRIAEVLKENNVKIILLTSSPLSPISKYADIVLTSAAKETHYHLDSLSSRISQIAIVDTLFVCITLKLKEKANKSIQLNKKIIDSTRM